MRILFVSPTFPYPPTDGGKIRVFNLLKQLSLQNEVAFLSFQTSPSEQMGIDELKKLGVKVEVIKPKSNLNLSYKVMLRSIFRLHPITVAKYFDLQMSQRISEYVKSAQFDVIHFEMIHMGQYLKRAKGVLWSYAHEAHEHKTKMVLSEQNIDSDVWKRMYKNVDDPIRKFILWVQHKLFERLEGSLCPLFDLCICVSERDKGILSSLANLSDLSNLNADSRVKVEVIPNGVDLQLYKPDEASEVESMILFTGSMDWYPNEDAVIFFCDEILPKIQSEKPDTRFYIVGQNPSHKVSSLSDRDGVVVTGRVDDIKPYINRASVYVVPLRVGGGTRLKILEAIAMKKAVISTSIGAEGLELANGKEVLIADSAEEFIRLVLRLLADKGLRKELGQNGRRAVEEKYGWDRIGQKLAQTYNL